MGLNATKHIINDKSVYYSTNLINGEWSYFTQNVKTTFTVAFEYHRYCTQTVEWVGCSYEDASDLKEQLIDKYNRTYSTSSFSPNSGDFVNVSQGKKLMADVSMIQARGHLYTVTLNVREEDVKIRKAAAWNPTVLFATENNRGYE